jgi:hypothetical protein
MKWWGLVIVAACILSYLTVYACCVAAGRADEQMGIK